jgi:hypothetical protein
MANVLGSCVVDAPHLQSELVSLLRPEHAQHIADRSSSVEALAAGAALALCHKGKDAIYATRSLHCHECGDSGKRVPFERQAPLFPGAADDRST